MEIAKIYKDDSSVVILLFYHTLQNFLKGLLPHNYSHIMLLITFMNYFTLVFAHLTVLCLRFLG